MILLIGAGIVIDVGPDLLLVNLSPQPVLTSALIRAGIQSLLDGDPSTAMFFFTEATPTTWQGW